MTTLTILRGVSGSGKSTWARQQNAVVVSRDAIRVSLFGPVADTAAYYQSPTLSADEYKVTLAQDAQVTAFLKAGVDVVVDNTNIEWKFVKALAKIGYRYGATVEVKVFDVDLQTATNRMMNRHAMGGRAVDPVVIRKQYDRFKSNKNMTLEPVAAVKPYNGTLGQPKAFLVDIDGTLAHMGDRRGPFEWAKVDLDEPDEVVADIVRTLNNSLEYYIIVMSGRDEVCRDATEQWLKDWDIPFDCLFMRPEGDMRPDNLVKMELFDRYVRHDFNVKFVLDDRDQVVEAWRRMGLTCLQVAERAF